MKIKTKTLREYINRAYDTALVPVGIEYWTKVLTSKCLNMFMYKNLPDTVPAWALEIGLIVKGNQAIIEKDGALWAPFTGNSYYDKDPYYVPNKFVFAQPALGSGNYKDYDRCAICWNTEADKMLPTQSIMFETITRYARMLADVESTFSSFLIAQRANRVGIARNTQTATAMNVIMEKVAAGVTDQLVEPSMGIIDSWKNMDFQPTGSLSEFGQIRDYLLNCFYNEIGLQTLEEKKERMITDELTTDKTVLSGNFLRMLESRIANVIKINDVFGLNVEVIPNPATTGKLFEEPEEEEITEDFEEETEEVEENDS